MKIGTINQSEEIDIPDEDDPATVAAPSPAQAKQEGNVVMKFTTVPPNATLDDCMEATRFPYMKFPFKYFNPLQTAFFPEADKDNNVVVCGATSAGKTIIAEMGASAILENPEKYPNAKAAYICPLKALAAEKERDWTSPDHFFYKYNVSILTGDYILTDARKAELAAANIICMSSEMLGSRIRRNQTEKNAWLNEISVLIVDEAHLLTVEERGPNLEVAIMKFTKVNPDARVVFLSATMPNVREMADWLTKLNGKPTTVIKSDYRPVDLKWNHETFVSQKYYNANEKSKVSATLSVVHRHPRDKFLIFVHTKKMGKKLLVALGNDGISSQFHSADLTREKREVIETSFRSREPGSLRVLVSTSTLAWGCFHPNTRVILGNGEYKKISDINKGQKVISLTTDTKLAPKEVQKSGKKRITDNRAYHIKISNGESITCSDNHPLLIARKGRMEYVPTKEIKKLDWIACVGRIPPIGTGKKPQQKDVIQARLLGLIFGDGCLVRAGEHADKSPKFMLDIAAHKSQKAILNRARTDLLSFLPKDRKQRPNIVRNIKDGVLHLRTKSRIITDMIWPYMKKLPKRDLYIPSFIMRDNILLREFIQWVFYADGGANKHSKDNYSVEIAITDKILAYDIRYALLRFGVYAQIYKRKTKGRIGYVKKLDNHIHCIRSKKDTYRVRVFSENLIGFYKNVGFPKGTYKQQMLTKAIKKMETRRRMRYNRDLIPLGWYIKEYRLERNIQYNDLKKYLDIYSVSKGIKLTTRKTLQKVVIKFGNTSTMKRWLSPDIRWERIKNIRKTRGGFFYDLSVQNNNSYTANTIVAHNCNLPARRVLITGLHRGMSLVEPLDIIQMGGRAGRVGLDKQGDVHVLVRSDHRQKDIDFCSIRQPIESKINDASAIAFHIVSEVSEKNVKTGDDAYEWFRRSLAYHQLAENGGKDFEKESKVFIQEIMQKLVECGALKQNLSKEYYPTPIGKVASWFYFCPFDVASWKKNFATILKNEKPTSADIAWAIGNTDGNSKDYSVDLDPTVLGKMIKQFTSAGSTSPGAEKHVFALWHILTGRDASPEFYSMVTQYQMDGARTAQAIGLLESYGKYFQDLPGQNVLLELPYRLRYGLGEKGLELLMLPGVGRKTALQIMQTRRIYTCKDLCASHTMGNPVFSEVKWEKVKLAAETIAKIGYVRYLTHLKAARRAKN